MTRLARAAILIDRYGAAIEYDLHARVGLDLLDFFNGTHSWRKLLAILDGLPSGSAYWAARANDDDAAQESLAAHGPPKKGNGAPALAEMTLSNQLLMTTVDMLTVLVDRVERLGGGKPTPPKPMARPETAWQRAERLIERAAGEALIAEAKAAQARNN